MNNSGSILNFGFLGNAVLNNAGTLNNTGTILNVPSWWRYEYRHPKQQRYINISYGGSLSNFGTFNNSGTISAFASVVLAIAEHSSIQEQLALRRTSSQTVARLTTTAAGQFTGSSGGGIDNSGIINNHGSISEVHFNNSGTLNNSGLILSESAASLTNTGTLNNLGGTIDIGSGPGEIDNTGGVLTNDASGTITSRNALNNTLGATLNNAGTLNNSGGTIFNDPTSTITNTGTLNNTGSVNNSGIFTNSGAVKISSTGLFTTSTNYTQTAGSTIVNGILTATGSALVDIERGALGGTGTINGNVAMGGTLTPGATGTPGTLVIFGNYEQLGNGTLEELMGPVSHSFLDVSGNVMLDPGSLLDITLLNGFDPLNQTFSIMDFESRVGQFSNGPSFSDDGFIWDITYRQHEIDVTAVQPTPEPSSLLLLFIGLAALAFYVPRRMDKTQRLA